VKTGDMATAEKMAAQLGAKIKTPAAAPANPHAEHGGAPASAQAPAGQAAGAPAPAMGGEGDKGVQIMHKELLAMIAQAKGQTDQAIALLTEATKIEESMRAPNGAADPVKPSHELLGEVLLAAGKHKEAAVAFDTSLLRMPNRARSLMGAIKAHAGAGNKTRAAELQATLNSFWKGKPFSGTTTDVAR
jgi:hypothetical protein